MNERIEKMMLDATKDMPQCYYVPGEYFQKFAELIVKECSMTIQDFVDHRFPASEYPDRLKRYFGVER